MNVKPSLFKAVCISSIFLPLFVLSTTAAVAAIVTLRWDPNTPNPDGYRVFARKSDQTYDYSKPDWEGASVSCTLDKLEGQSEYYFVVRAYDDGLESSNSIEVKYTPPVIDNDGDDIPDDWEARFGLNPRIDDAEGDHDHDGISNRDEYRAGIEPDERGVGQAPQIPQPISPKSYSQTGFNALLDAGDYADVDGDAHIATQWQVYDTLTKDCLLDVVTDNRLNQLQVPSMLLDGQRTYYWRVRFFDSGGLVSGWSTQSYFITQPAENDLDENGVSDNRESDGLQSEFTRSLTPLPANCDPTHLVADSGNTIKEIKQVTLMDPFELEIDETAPDQLPVTMVAYKLMLHRPGQRALVTIGLSGPAPAGAKWIKYDSVNGWQDYSHHAAISTDRRSVTVEVKDGSYGDADGVANGIILDPAGLSLAAVDSSTSPAAGGGGGGGGCFINTLFSASAM